jgi:HAD superfamily hydrolase (TIGR01509 family)
MIKLIIFDMDGVLVDACEWHKEALNESLMELCNISISDEEHYTKYNGLPTKVKLKKLCDLGFLLEKDIEKIEDLKQNKTINIINEKAFIRYEKIELLEYIKTKQIFVACYTNSIKNTTELMLRKTGILHLFDLIITNQDVEKSKPDPEGYNKIINFFNVSANETIIIEDSPKGIEAANKTGAIVLKVKNPEEVNLKLLRTRI